MLLIIMTDRQNGTIVNLGAVISSDDDDIVIGRSDESGEGRSRDLMALVMKIRRVGTLAESMEFSSNTVFGDGDGGLMLLSLTVDGLDYSMPRCED